MAAAILVLTLLVAGISALPTDPVLMKLDDGQRYSYLEDDSGQAHLVDNWVKISDLAKMARFEPDSDNVYHLFTRDNPSISQPLVLGNEDLVRNSHFDPRRKTVVIMHGFAGSATSGINTVLVPAFLAGDTFNVLCLDWSAGSHWGPLAIQAGQGAGRFINWLNSVTGSTPDLYHIVGYSVGGHGAGIIARNVDGMVSYVTGLDPAERWDQAHLLQPSDAEYTEAIHTSDLGEQSRMAHNDFYPNGGKNNPGCLTSLCDHYRSYYFLAESIVRGGFTGIGCNTVEEAQRGDCNLPTRMRMGGLQPKTGTNGIYYLTTNPFQPFSQG